MIKSIEILALRRQLLQARATLSRAQIRSELDALQDPQRWAQAGVTAVKTHPVRYTLIGLALYGVARGRLQRWLVPAARTLLLTGFSRIVMNLMGKPSVPPSRP